MMHPIPTYALYLIDADGTLLDFEAGEAIALAHTLAHFGLPGDEASIATYRQINSALWRQMAEGSLKRDSLFSRRFALFAEALGMAADGVEVNRFFLQQLSHQGQQIPHAEEVLKALSQRAKVCIVTNGVSFAQKERFRRSGLMPYIHHLVVSEAVGAEKPSPRIFEQALTQSGHSDKSTVIMVGDEPRTDIAGANAFGIASCLYDPRDKYPEHEASFRIDSLLALVQG